MAFKKKTDKPRCITCKRRDRLKGRRKCWKCRKKENVWFSDPVNYSYMNLKSNAKRRGKVFTITLAYFKKFCYRTDYIAGKGRTSESYTVDRIREELGYIPGNIQVMQNGLNVKKYLNYDWQNKIATIQVVNQQELEDLPF